MHIEEHHVVRDRRLCSDCNSSSGWVGWWLEGCDEKKTFKKHWQFVRSTAPTHNYQPYRIFTSNADAAGCLYLRCHKPYVMEYLKTFKPDMCMDIGYVYVYRCLLCAHCV